MTIRKDLTTVNFTVNGMREVRGIVLHSMSGFYNGTISWFKNPAAQASAQYIISKNGDILQMVEDKDMAWHAGFYDSGKCPAWALPNPNFYTIGIELEDERNIDWQYPEKQRQALRELVEMLRQKYLIPKERILLHKNLNPSRRTDPVGAFSFDWLFPATPTPPAQTSELAQCNKDRDINWNSFVTLCTALGVTVDASNKDATVKRAVIRINELKQSAVPSGELAKLQDKLKRIYAVCQE